MSRTDRFVCTFDWGSDPDATNGGKNSDKGRSGARRTLIPPAEELSSVETDRDPHPPLLRKLLKEYAATGLPPAYIAKNNSGGDHA